MVISGRALSGEIISQGRRDVIAVRARKRQRDCHRKTNTRQVRTTIRSTAMTLDIFASYSTADLRLYLATHRDAINCTFVARARVYKYRIVYLHARQASIGPFLYSVYLRVTGILSYVMAYIDESSCGSYVPYARDTPCINLLLTRARVRGICYRTTRT